MRRTIIAVSILLITVTLFIILFLETNSPAEPKLKMEFNPPPPWHTRMGQNLELNVTIENEGNSPAKNVNITLTAPVSFTILQSRKNKYSINFTKLEAAEKQNRTLSITIPGVINPGNYTINTTIFAENVLEESCNYQITVELPYIP